MLLAYEKIKSENKVFLPYVKEESFESFLKTDRLDHIDLIFALTKDYSEIKGNYEYYMIDMLLKHNFVTFEKRFIETEDINTLMLFVTKKELLARKFTFPKLKKIIFEHKTIQKEYELFISEVSIVEKFIDAYNVNKGRNLNLDYIKKETKKLNSTVSKRLVPYSWQDKLTIDELIYNSYFIKDLVEDKVKFEYFGYKIEDLTKKQIFLLLMGICLSSKVDLKTATKKFKSI